MGGPTTQRTYMSNPSNITSHASHVIATAPHGQASRINTTESRYGDTAGGLTYSASAVSEASSLQSLQSEFVDDRSHTSTRFVDVIPSNPKIESKDHMWKPAPIMGRDFTQREVNEPEVTRPGQF